MHFRGNVGQIKRFFHRGVAAADNRDFLVAIEETVAGGAGRNPAAFKRFFGWQTEITGRGAGSDDQRVTGVFTAVTRQAERTVLQVDLVDVIEQNFGFEFSGMLVHALHQQRPGQVVRVPRQFSTSVVVVS